MFTIEISSRALRFQGQEFLLNSSGETVPQTSKSTIAQIWKCHLEPLLLVAFCQQHKQQEQQAGECVVQLLVPFFQLDEPHVQFMKAFLDDKLRSIGTATVLKLFPLEVHTMLQSGKSASSCILLDVGHAGSRCCAILRNGEEIPHFAARSSGRGFASVLSAVRSEIVRMNNNNESLVSKSEKQISKLLNDELLTNLLSRQRRTQAATTTRDELDGETARPRLFVGQGDISFLFIPTAAELHDIAGSIFFGGSDEETGYSILAAKPRGATLQRCVAECILQLVRHATQLFTDASELRAAVSNIVVCGNGWRAFGGQRGEEEEFARALSLGVMDVAECDLTNAASASEAEKVRSLFVECASISFV